MKTFSLSEYFDVSRIEKEGLTLKIYRCKICGNIYQTQKNKPLHVAEHAIEHHLKKGEK